MTEPYTPDDLDTDFAALRAATPAAPRPFVEQAMADALAHMPAAKPVRRGPWVALGGWRAMLTMGGAALAGLSVGYLDPSALTPLTGETLLAYDTTLAPEADDPFAALLDEADP